ncbi:MAG: hypothetical protein M3Y53_06320 [Thermoproteota archaeon]|nr:hypothetical protein [Thermoproteota archaeon]
MLQQYHSGLEHTFVWIVDAQDAHAVQNFMAAQMRPSLGRDDVLDVVLLV